MFSHDLNFVKIWHRISTHHIFVARFGSVNTLRYCLVSAPPYAWMSSELLLARWDEKRSPGHLGRHRGGFDDDAFHPTQPGGGGGAVMGTWSCVIMYFEVYGIRSRISYVGLYVRWLIATMIKLIQQIRARPGQLICQRGVMVDIELVHCCIQLIRTKLVLWRIFVFCGAWYYIWYV